MHDGAEFVFRLNDNGTGPSLLVQVCLERGWRGYQPEAAPDRWNLWWRSGSPSPSRKHLQPWQFVNHIPKGASICRKDNLARHLRCMKKVYGSIYDFSPLGYNLPLEYAKLAAECSKIRTRLYAKDYDDSEDVADQKIWICKPVGQSQGRGIYLFRRLGDLTCDTNSVVQRYIERPLLIGGYKFDLRLYVCIPSYRPLTVYLYREGLARFSTDKFSLADLSNPFRHLTNSSLNKFGPKYAECKDRIGSGCKWTLREVRRHVSASCAFARAREWLVWQRVAALVALTALAQAAGVPPAPNCFELFGFDVLVDADLRPWLLEVNLSPALANHCDADEAVKKPMLHDLFDLLALPLCNTGLALLFNNNDNNAGSHVEAGIANGNSESGDVDLRIPRECDSSSYRKRPSSGSPTKPPSLANGQRRSVPAITLTFPAREFAESAAADEDTWGRYSAARKADRCPRRNAKPSEMASTWGNGRDWSLAPNSVGGWVKLFPLDSVVERCKTSDRDIRAGVADVARYSKAAKAVERKFPHADDDRLNGELRKELRQDVQIWLPEK